MNKRTKKIINLMGKSSALPIELKLKKFVDKLEVKTSDKDEDKNAIPPSKESSS